MTQSTIANEFLLLVNNYPAAQGLYFRAIASLSGYVDSISQPVGAFNLISDVPPKVTMTPPSPALAGGGDGSSPDKPILLQSGFFSFGASVQSGQPLKYLGLGIDGTILSSFENGETSGSVVTLNVIGDHVLEAVAVDKLGGTRRSDAGLLYIRIVPGGSSLKAARRWEQCLPQAPIGYLLPFGMVAGEILLHGTGITAILGTAAREAPLGPTSQSSVRTL